MRTKPKIFQEGDSVALISPSAVLEPARLSQVEKDLRAEGYCVHRYQKKISRHSYFSASDRDRARELLWAMTEPGIKAVFCSRGGYGFVRCLDALEKIPGAIQKMKTATPRWILGYSDTTFFHHWLNHQGIRGSIHGPLMGFLDRSQMKKTLKSFASLTARRAGDVESWSEVQILQKGKRAQGICAGGNLSCLWTVGKSSLPKVPLILFVEEVNENHYEIDRLVWQLIQAGYQKWVKAIVLGQFNGCGQKDKKVFPWSEVEKSFKRLCKGPILKNAHFGHQLGWQKRMIPLGVKIEVAGKTIRYLEDLGRP